MCRVTTSKVVGGHILDLKTLMITARAVGGAANLERVKEINRELNKVIRDLERAVDGEAPHSAKNNRRRSLPRPGDSPFSVYSLAQKEQQRKVQDFLRQRLKPVETSHHRDLCCMEGTRKVLLKKITNWVSSISGQGDGLYGNICWIHGLPGIGKTSLAHSICASLYGEEQLAGAFFCRRGDPVLSEPRNILPTLIHEFAIVFPPFRSIVAERLSKNPNMIPESMEHTLFLDFIRKLPRIPKRTLVFVIDALDECSSTQTHPDILKVLKVLTDAAAHAPWLKVITTSRPEVDIQRFFDGPESVFLHFDLTTDKETTSDLLLFARARFSRVALKRHLQSPWPEPFLFDTVTSRAGSLFIFIETLALALEHCHDPTQLLEAIIPVSAGPGLAPLYRLYSSIASARRVQSNAEFQRVIGVLLIAAPHRPLREQTIAELARVRRELVRMWVEDLGSMFYCDEGASGGIRVRHLSVSDFFLSEDCPREYQVNLRDANMQLGIACLDTMIEQLRFNICKLEDSRLANDDVKDLPSRIKDNISDALQYSSLYWSNHVSFAFDRRALKSLKEVFKGPLAIFWVEVLSIMGVLRAGGPSLQKVMSSLVEVSAPPAHRNEHSNVILTC